MASTKLKQFVTGIADAIRKKKGSTDLINPQNFASEIENIGNDKLRQIIDRSVTEITENDLIGVTVIGSRAFNTCRKLTNVTIPDGVTMILASAFQECAVLTSVVIPNSVLNIEGYAFYMDPSLPSINIPNSVTNIGSRVFDYCESLIDIVIGYGVKKIGNLALNIGSPTNKATITMRGSTPPTIQSDTIGPYVERIIVPTGTRDAYIAATNWSNYADMIEEEEVWTPSV